MQSTLENNAQFKKPAAEQTRNQPNRFSLPHRLVNTIVAFALLSLGGYGLWRKRLPMKMRGALKTIRLHGEALAFFVAATLAGAILL
jgi:hypothetical protein